MVRFLGTDPMASSSNPFSTELSLEVRRVALCNSRRMKLKGVSTLRGRILTLLNKQKAQSPNFYLGHLGRTTFIFIKDFHH